MFYFTLRGREQRSRLGWCDTLGGSDVVFVLSETSLTEVYNSPVKVFFVVFVFFLQELNKAWCSEIDKNQTYQLSEERRRKSPLGRQVVSDRVESNQGRQPRGVMNQGRPLGALQKKTGKENRPKGRLK